MHRLAETIVSAMASMHYVFIHGYFLARIHLHKLLEPILPENRKRKFKHDKLKTKHGPAVQFVSQTYDTTTRKQTLTEQWFHFLETMDFNSFLTFNWTSAWLLI